MEEGYGFVKGAVPWLIHTLYLAPVAGRKWGGGGRWLCERSCILVNPHFVSGACGRKERWQEGKVGRELKTWMRLKLPEVLK